MRKVEKNYDGRESPEWRGELVKLLSGVVYDYLKGEGLLRSEEKLSKKAKKAVEKARGIVDRGGERWEEQIENNPCSPEDTKLY